MVNNTDNKELQYSKLIKMSVIEDGENGTFYNANTALALSLYKNNVPFDTAINIMNEFEQIFEPNLSQYIKESLTHESVYRNENGFLVQYMNGEMVNKWSFDDIADHLKKIES